MSGRSDAATSGGCQRSDESLASGWATGGHSTLGKRLVLMGTDFFLFFAAVLFSLYKNRLQPCSNF